MPKGKHIKSEQERKDLFLSYVQINWDSGCWEWTGDCMTGGYGRIEIDKKKVGAHRFAYNNFVGPLEEGKEVAHTCDNPRCVSPAHLNLLTHAENMRDMKNKGRARNRYTKTREMENKSNV